MLAQVFGFWILTCVFALAGCSSAIDLFHRTEGGKIAQSRPPPPGQDQPYPNLASVPARPPAPDQMALQQISNSLISDRLNAQHLAESAPLPDTSSPTGGSTQPVGIGAAQELAGSNGAASAAGPGASATLAAATLPRSAEAQSAPLPTALGGAPIAAPTSANPPAPPQFGQPGPMPALHASGSPPGAATAAYSPAEPSSTALAANTAAEIGSGPLPPASSPEVALPPAPPLLPPDAANTVGIPFAPESASVPPISDPMLKALAAKRGNRLIAAIGYGDATSVDPDAQAAGVALGLRRAQAVATALIAAGVPASAIRISAEAGGRGGAAQLIK